MAGYLRKKHILLGITGSIAAYKSADLARRLREAQAIVRVAMTTNAKRFITPLTMQAVSGFPIHDDLFDLQAEAAMGHIELARWADVIVIAPASADFIARLAQGMADDLLTTLCLATSAPIVIAPAMNQAMWKHMLTQRNLQVLQDHRVHCLQPGEGSQACGDVGPGRMLEPTAIVEAIDGLFKTEILNHTKVMVTAGPTHEAIDPVRYITNHSSGKMGYAIAEAAQAMGAEVILISGPTELPQPEMEVIQVTTAEEMLSAVMSRVAEIDLFIGVAAVGDYRAVQVAPQKICKKETELQLKLTLNPDIVSQVAALKNKPFVVGFAAETQDVINNAKEKLKRKRLDMVVANQVGPHCGMGTDDNTVTAISIKEEKKFPLMRKEKLATTLMSYIAQFYKNHLRE